MSDSALYKVNPSADELKKFGLIFGLFVALVFGGLLPWIWGFRFPIWPWIVFGIVGSLGLVAPNSLRLVYRVWMFIGGVLGWVNTRLILGLVFFLLFLPFGIMMRAVGRDPLKRRLDSSLESYRLPSVKIQTDHVEKPY